MFLRKLTVIVVPLALGWALCVLFPLLSGLGFMNTGCAGAHGRGRCLSQS